MRVEPVAPAVDARADRHRFRRGSQRRGRSRYRRSHRSRRSRLAAGPHFEDGSRPVADHRDWVVHGGRVARLNHVLRSVKPVHALEEFVTVIRVRTVGSGGIASFRQMLRPRRNRPRRFRLAVGPHFEDGGRPIADHRDWMIHGGRVARLLHVFSSVLPVHALEEFVTVVRVGDVGSGGITSLRQMLRPRCRRAVTSFIFFNSLIIFHTNSTTRKKK